MTTKIFNEDQIPYKLLEQFGLTQKMIEDLPLQVMNNLLRGEPTPKLPISITDENGDTIQSRSRIALVNVDDNVDVLFLPEVTKSNIAQYTAEQQELLLSGRPVITDVVKEDGKKSKAFIQLDIETGQVLSTPTPTIARNLQICTQQFGLSSAEARVIQQGEALTFVLDDEPVTVGIDLKDDFGIRMCPGDEERWRRNIRPEYDRYTFGVYGCWQADDNGNLSYIPEEEYTKEIWDEQKKAAQRNASIAR